MSAAAPAVELRPPREGDGEACGRILHAAFQGAAVEPRDSWFPSVEY